MRRTADGRRPEMAGCTRRSWPRSRSPPIGALLVLAIACGAAIAALRPAPTAASALAAVRTPTPAAPLTPLPAPGTTPYGGAYLVASEVHAVATAVARGEEPGAARIPDPTDRREIAAIAAWLAAYNAGDVDAVVALLDEEGFSYLDCDYARGELFAARSERELVAAWLRARFAEHDRLVLGSLHVWPGTVAVAVRLQHRTSDALRRRGFPDGIAPTTFVGKWVVTPGPSGRDGRLRQVMLAASSSEDCALAGGRAAAADAATLAKADPVAQATSLLPSGGLSSAGTAAMLLLGGLAASAAGLAVRLHARPRHRRDG